MTALRIGRVDLHFLQFIQNLGRRSAVRDALRPGFAAGQLRAAHGVGGDGDIQFALFGIVIHRNRTDDGSARSFRSNFTVTADLSHRRVRRRPGYRPVRRIIRLHNSLQLLVPTDIHLRGRFLAERNFADRDLNCNRMRRNDILRAISIRRILCGDFSSARGDSSNYAARDSCYACVFAFPSDSLALGNIVRCQCDFITNTDNFVCPADRQRSIRHRGERAQGQDHGESQSQRQGLFSK